MKIVWTIVALLLVAGIVVVLQPPAPTRRPDDSALIDSAERAMELAASPAKPALKETDTATKDRDVTTAAPLDLNAALQSKSSELRIGSPADASSSPTSAATGDAAAVASTQDLRDADAKTDAKTDANPDANPDAATAAKEASAQKPSPEPKAAKPEEIAAGSEFTPEIPTIAQAEILPSRFVKLPDGDISVDDAWTIRGAGTNESPYEVSWEFLSSAQETYVPRLSEKKIPARIAFLHGKVVKISGYLAFPLVAPTSSECLAMLNQWDGCCIGIPPTPYDAIEVKLANELKGWKKHTINFGAITGVLKVEPYLVENWLVGLYLMEKSKIDTEL